MQPCCGFLGPREDPNTAKFRSLTEDPACVFGGPCGHNTCDPGHPLFLTSLSRQSGKLPELWGLVRWLSPSFVLCRLCFFVLALGLEEDRGHLVCTSFSHPVPCVPGGWAPSSPGSLPHCLCHRVLSGSPDGPVVPPSPASPPALRAACIPFPQQAQRGTGLQTQPRSLTGVPCQRRSNLPAASRRTRKDTGEGNLMVLFAPTEANYDPLTL